jgi:GT2 family glycosyltransferase
MKLSVILPCFNGAATLAVQLEALARQVSRHAWEVVVVNNGSTDDSMQIVAGYAGRLPGLRIVEAYDGDGPRLGVTHSYAVGFAAAQGDAFLLCEADDEVGEGWLSTLGDALLEHELVAAALDYDRLNAEHVRPKEWKQQSAQEGLSTISGPTFWPYASGCSLGLRRSVYERLGDPDGRCAASWDTDYCWRARLAGIQLVFVPAATVHYRLRNTLKGAYRQGRSWGAGHAVLYNKYAAPLPTRVAVIKRELRYARDLAKHVVGLPKVVARKQPLNGWLWGLGWCVATLEGGKLHWQALSRAAASH